MSTRQLIKNYLEMNVVWSFDRLCSAECRRTAFWIGVKLWTGSFANDTIHWGRKAPSTHSNITHKRIHSQQVERILRHQMSTQKIFFFEKRVQIQFRWWVCIHLNVLVNSYYENKSQFKDEIRRKIISPLANVTRFVAVWKLLQYKRKWFEKVRREKKRFRNNATFHFELGDTFFSSRNIKLCVSFKWT